MLAYVVRSKVEVRCIVNEINSCVIGFGHDMHRQRVQGVGLYNYTQKVKLSL
jgi:hypothetical protein